MKTFSVLRKIWVLLLIAPAIFIIGCSKNFDVPPVEIPYFILPDGASIITIDSLKSRHTVEGELDSINDNIYVTGIVISSDETGNIYKSLYIQDTSGGLLISLDNSSLYTHYRLGQRIYVKCQGLFLGDYSGMTQLGAIYAGEIGRIADPVIDQYLFLDSLPGPLPAAKLITIPTITSKDLGTLVKLENVHFEDAGFSFSEPSESTDRNIVDAADEKLIMRNSNYATFHATLIPEGTGTIYGVLGIYNSKNQLYIRDLNDLVGFDWSAKIILKEAFNVDPGWPIYSVASNNNWGWTSTYKCLLANNYGGDVPAEDWVFSPEVNLAGLNSAKLSFATWSKYSDAAITDPLQAFVSNNYIVGNAPNTATWTQLTFTPCPYNSTLTPSGNIDLSAYIGQKIRIAWKYRSSGNGSGSTSNWEVDNVLITGK
jgi:hypothetical protein